jgi:hypothetical protein
VKFPDGLAASPGYILLSVLPRRGRSLEGAGVGKLAIVKEIWAFLRERKKWWLLPILAMLVLMAGLVILTEGSAIAPFIYALF